MCINLTYYQILDKCVATAAILLITLMSKSNSFPICSILQSSSDSAAFDIVVADDLDELVCSSSRIVTTSPTRIARRSHDALDTRRAMRIVPPATRVTYRASRNARRVLREARRKSRDALTPDFHFCWPQGVLGCLPCCERTSEGGNHMALVGSRSQLHSLEVGALV